MRKKLVLLCTIGTLFLAGYTQANSRNVELVKESDFFTSGNKVAIVVGINGYSKLSGLKRLNYAQSDAKVINDVLTKLHGYESVPLLGGEANKNHIFAAIKNAGTRLKGNNGTLVFFFAGHGFSRGDSNYLATTDFVMEHGEKSALSISRLETAIQETGVRRAIIFIDACRNDPWIERSRDLTQDSFIVQKSKGIQYLFGSEFQKLSWETDKLQHGVFSYFLHKGLAGEATEKNGLISFNSLKEYVQEEVGKWSSKNLPVTQLPFYEGEAYGAFVLGKVDEQQEKVLLKSSEPLYLKDFPYTPEILWHNVENIQDSRKTYHITLDLGIFENPNQKKTIEESIEKIKSTGVKNIRITYRMPDSVSKYHNWHLIVDNEYSTLKRALEVYHEILDKVGDNKRFPRAYIAESCYENGELPKCY